jgi:hypothetical protein
MILFALSFGDFSMAIGDWFSWYFNGIDRCGLGPERWGEDCSNSYSNR